MTKITTEQYYVMLSDEIDAVNEARAIAFPRIVAPDNSHFYRDGGMSPERPDAIVRIDDRTMRPTGFEDFRWWHWYTAFWGVLDCIAIALMIHSKVAR